MSVRDAAIFRLNMAPRKGSLMMARYHRIFFRPGAPNPFRAKTTIHFVLPEKSKVRISVHDVRGRRVAVLADGWYDAGRHSEIWLGCDTGPGAVPYLRRGAVQESSEMMGQGRPERRSTAKVRLESNIGS